MEEMEGMRERKGMSEGMGNGEWRGKRRKDPCIFIKKIQGVSRKKQDSV